MAKILVIITSCGSEKSTKLRKSCRDTWLLSAKDQKNIEYFFVSGKKCGEDDVVVLDCDDTYMGLPDKVQKSFQYALENYDFDYIFKCDDDTFVRLDRLGGLVGGDYGLIGSWTIDYYNYAEGGPGYFVSKKWVEFVAKSPPFPKGYEDKFITGAILREGATFDSRKELRQNNKIFPRERNDIATCHHTTPEINDFIIKNFTDDLGDYLVEKCRIRNKSWEDTVFLLKDGIFRREMNGDRGNWSKEDGILCLDWTDWDVERFYKEENIYKNVKQ